MSLTGRFPALFSLIAWIKTQENNVRIARPELSEQEAVFVEALGWFPWYFLITLVGTVLFFRFRFQKNPPTRNDRS